MGGHARSRVACAPHIPTSPNQSGRTFKKPSEGGVRPASGQLGLSSKSQADGPSPALDRGPLSPTLLGTSDPPRGGRSVVEPSRHRGPGRQTRVWPPPGSLPLIRPPEHAAGSGVPKGLPEERGRHCSREAAEAPAGEHTAGGEATPPPPPPQPAPCSPGGRAAAPRPLAKGCPRAAGGQRPGRRPVPCSPPPESRLHVAQTRAVLGRFYDT